MNATLAIIIITGIILLFIIKHKPEHVHDQAYSYMRITKKSDNSVYAYVNAERHRYSILL